MTHDRHELREADDQTIDDAVRHADPMVLRGLLYQLTGDEELVDVPLAMTVVGGCREMYRVADRADVRRIRTKAAAFLREYRDSGAGELPIGPPERLHRSLGLTAGVDIDPREMEIWLEELALDPLARGLRWPQGAPPEGTAEFSVLVIGAGMGGLNAAVLLRQAGIPFTVLEKNSEVGGTWHENRYPGARVDSPSRVYTHLYGVDFPHPYPYCPQEVNEAYFNWVADTHELRGSIRFDTEVRSIVWDDDAQLWEVTAEDREGTRTHRASAVISAVGFLSRPNIPKLEGIEQFGGRWCHTARWPADLDLAGRRVAVIGTGCTGYQLIPEIVEQAEHVYVVQRTPNWIYHAPGYLDPYPPQVTWLDRNVPYLTNFSRFAASYMQRPQNTLAALQVDPEFSDEHAVSAVNKAIRDERLAFLEKKLAHRPDLLAAMTPTAPPMSARPVLVDAERQRARLPAPRRRHAADHGRPPGHRGRDRDARTGPGTRSTSSSWRPASGPTTSSGRWRSAAGRAAGSRTSGRRTAPGPTSARCSPGFPNFFMVYGPNTNVLSGMQVVDMEELTTRFALEAVAGLVEQRRRTVEVTEDAYWRFNGVLDAAEQFMTYVDPRQSNYYQNQFGRSAANNPLDTRLLWNWLRDPAGRRPAETPLEVDEGLLEQYRTVVPRFGADLVVG